MKKISVILAAAVVAGSALLPLQSANAFFGGGPWWGGYGWGGYGWGGPWGWGGPYGWGGYPGYGWGGYPGYGWGGYPGWGGYGYPYAMTAPVIVQQPATAKK